MPLCLQRFQSARLRVLYPRVAGIRAAWVWAVLYLSGLCGCLSAGWVPSQEKAGVVTADGKLLPPRWVVRDMMWQSMLALV
jgi:hypothetical protein